MFQFPGDQWIGGRWISANGEEFDSTRPTDEQRIWLGRAATTADVDAAFAAARTAFGSWQHTPLAQREQHCRQFADYVRNHSDALQQLISQETGKPLWEAKTEVATVVGKIEISIEALRGRRDTQSFEMSGFQAVTRYKPHGVLCVLGPYNFPAHLPNAHIVPALLAGNTVVFKPSELTPAVGNWLTQAWQAAGLPDGVLNLIQGGRETGQAAASHPQLDGLLFTGSSQGGRALHRAFADAPHKILALEMGGNNALVVDRVASIDAAVYQILLSGYSTAGQRCTCARRLILVENEQTPDLLKTLQQKLSQLRFGYYTDQPEPFYGTVISRQAGRHILQAFQHAVDSGARVWCNLESQRQNPALLSPGLIEWTDPTSAVDEEVFGPLLSVFRAPDLAAAIDLANRSQYGLSAGLLSDSREAYDQFISNIRAGIVNWNRQTTGASGKLPFGGCGMSGNHRPAGYFSADYCSYPIASLESAQLAMPEKLEVGIQW